jgi:hypothetical protein
MKQTRKQWAALAAGVAAVMAGGTSGHAQSSDALIDKLVDKGILTTREANELREEVDKDFTRAYQAKSGLKDWVTALRMGGDFRARYDHINSLDDLDGFSNRDRYRFRLRYGVTAVLSDNLEVGLRLATGAIDGNPISRNQTSQDNGSLKAIGVDQAYGRFTPIRNNLLEASLTVGKMANPFVFSDLVFDEDYTPEGIAANVNVLLSDAHTLKFAAGAFALDEISTSSQDPFMFGVQARFDSKWTPHLETSAGVALLSLWREERLRSALTTTTTSTNAVIDPVTGLPTGSVITNLVSTTRAADVPDINRGNSRSGGVLAANYNPIVADAAVTFSLESFPFMYTGPFPIRVGGDFIYNPAIPDRNKGYTLGVTFGKSGKRRTWDLTYRYKYLEGDAWYEEVVDSNSGAIYAGGTPAYFAGTNIKGHMFKAQFSPYDALTLGVTYHLYRLIEESPSDTSEAGRLMVDLVWRF